MKKFLISLLTLILLTSVLLTGCLETDPLKKEAKTFTESGLTITLTEGFTKTTLENYTVAFDSVKLAVFALREAFTLMEGFEDYTLEDYGELLIEANKQSGVTLKNEDGLTWFEYDFENTEKKTTYHYYTYIYKASDAFWTVQFSCMASETDACKDAVKTYAKSVSFS